MRNKCFNEVAGFEELAKSGNLRLCFLHDPEAGYTDKRPKAPEGRTSEMIDEICSDYLFEHGVLDFESIGTTMKDFVSTINGKYNYRTVEEANLPKNINRNLGIVLPAEAEEFEEKWICIDIDGQDSIYTVKNNPELKVATRYYLFQCIKKGLSSRNIKFLCNTTQNNGFHIYFKTKHALFKDHELNISSYPTSVEAYTAVDATIFQKHPVLRATVGKPNSRGIIEVFTRGKEIVAPGSVVEGKKYRLLPDGVQDFREVSTYENGNVEELISEILVEDCGFVPGIFSHNGVKDNSVIFREDTQTLTQTNIKNIGNLIISAFKEIPGQKHYATLALGGFLQNQSISVESIKELGEYIVDNAPDSLFSGSKEEEKASGFVRVLSHDSQECEEKQRTGLTTLKKIFEDTKMPVIEITKVLWLNSAPLYHKFYPDGMTASTYNEFVIDFKNRQTKMFTMSRKDDETKRVNARIVNYILSDISYIDDISGTQTTVLEKKPISFTLRSRIMKDQVYIKDSTAQMIEDCYTMPTSHTEGAKKILTSVIDEYECLGIIGQVESSKIPGIYLSRDRKTLRKFIHSKGRIEEVLPSKPSKETLLNGIRILRQINDVYPWIGDKFATFIKLAMLLPYGYVFKSEYGSFIRGIILYGAAGTLKSSASEMVEYMNVPYESIKEKELDYILPGSEFSTVFRMGKALSAHSYPIAIEEVENVFNDPENRDLIKNSISRKFIRNPGGETEYYARAIPVFSANELSDEIEKSGMFRRFLILNFIESERGDIPEVEEALEFLNEEGVRNSKFKELYVISEYIYYTLANNLHYFAYSPQKIIDTILNDMQAYIEEDLSWLIKPQFDAYYNSDRSDENNTELSMVLDTLKYHFKNSIKLSGVASNVSEQFLENLIEDKYPYLYRIKNRESNGVLITNDFNKSYKKSYPNASKISRDRLAELLNNNLVLSKPAISAKMVPHGLKNRIRGVFMEWSDFCSIFNIKTEE